MREKRKKRKKKKKKKRGRCEGECMCWERGRVCGTEAE
jgi:hypothetical protein